MNDLFRYFRPEHGVHSKTNAYLCALLSYYIYPKAGPLKNAIPGPGSFSTRFRNLFRALSASDPFDVDFVNGSDAEAAVLVNSKVVIVVFRGTELSAGEWVTGNSANVLFGLRQMPDSWDYVSVHEGFYNALAQVYQSVRKRVREVDNTRPVFLTGHSRGGAMATLCAYRFKKVGGVQPANVYVYGSPRVGEEKWLDRYRGGGLYDRTFRWVHRYDFGHQVPDWGLVDAKRNARYRHVGQMNYYQTLQNVHFDHANPEFEPGIKPSSAGDHSMTNYCTILFNQLSSRTRRSSGTPPWLTKSDAGQPLPVMPG